MPKNAMGVTVSPDDLVAWHTSQYGIGSALRALERRVKGLKNNQKQAKHSEAIINTANRVNQWQKALNDYYEAFGRDSLNWNDEDIATKLAAWDAPRRDRLMNAVRQYSGIFLF